MACQQTNDNAFRTSITRRNFLKLTAGGAVCLALGISPALASPPYRVGVGNSADVYEATLKAVDACGEWPVAAMAEKTVAIKPNLVSPIMADTGTTTDPEVVRALVDKALASGAVKILIVENGWYGANFSACGYDGFNSYDPRVEMVDLRAQPLALVQIPGGLAYSLIYMPALVQQPDVIFISAGKMKTHFNTHVTLAVKNLMGLPPYPVYRIPPSRRSLDLHMRGINQAIVDLNLARPIDFAVVDGVWAMEGDGPTGGKPLRVDTVFAGSNAVAVDRACVEMMGIPQAGVTHLNYAARKGLGPADMSGVILVGDAWTPHSFQRPTDMAPLLEYPRILPRAFAPGSGQEADVFYWLYPYPCETRIDIVRTSDILPERTHVRILRDWAARPAGYEVLRWDGRDDAGDVVPKGVYSAWVQARYHSDGSVAYASSWVVVV